MRAGDRAEARALRVAAAQDDGVVAGDHVVAGAAVDHVAGVVAARNVVAADDVVVAGLAADVVGALAAEHDVVARARVDRVGAAVVALERVDRREAERIA